MGLSGPVRTIANSRRHVRRVCEDCLRADDCALEPGLICTDPRAPNFSRELYVWQPACGRHAAINGRDLSLHVYP
jgi:hypothetical protein